MSTLNIQLLCRETGKKIPKLSPFTFWLGTIINSQWLEPPMSRTTFYGPKDVRAIEVRLYFKEDRKIIHKSLFAAWPGAMINPHFTRSPLNFNSNLSPLIFNDNGRRYTTTNPNSEWSRSDCLSIKLSSRTSRLISDFIIRLCWEHHLFHGRLFMLTSYDI